MKKLIITLILPVLMATTAYAASDPMVSLFKFQNQMVLQGNVEAIMKLGEMYEQGQGTKKDLNKALEMYKKARAQGHNDAAKAIRRIEEAKKNLEIKRKEKVAREKAAREKAEKEKIMHESAVREETARDKAAKERAMKVRRQQKQEEDPPGMGWDEEDDDEEDVDEITGNMPAATK